MKYIRIAVITCCLLFVLSPGVFAVVAVPAPVDGGLLSILGAAGITYFIIRLKKRK